MRITVKFDSPDQDEVVAVFGSPQDPEFHQHLGEVEPDDERLVQFFAKVPEVVYG